MSKLFDTLEQIRSNESRPLHPPPAKAQTGHSQKRTGILALFVVLSTVAAAFVYFDDLVDLGKRMVSPSVNESVAIRSAIDSPLPAISSKTSVSTTNSKSSQPFSPEVTDADSSLSSRSLRNWQQSLQKTTLSQSERANLLNNIGSYYIVRKQHWKGLAYIDKALAIEPENVTFMVNFAVALAELGMEELAGRYFDNARLIDPANPSLKKNMKLLKQAGLMTTLQ